MLSLFEAIDVNDYQVWPQPWWNHLSWSSYKYHGSDSIHLHDPYRYAWGILGEESSCGMKRSGATILKVILTSSHFDDPYDLWYLSVLLLVTYLKPKLLCTKKILQKSFKMLLKWYNFSYVLSRISEGLLQNQVSWIPFCSQLPDLSLEICLLASH